MKNFFTPLNIAGLICTGVGFAATFIGNMISERKQDAVIDEKVTEKVAELMTKEGS